MLKFRVLKKQFTNDTVIMKTTTKNEMNEKHQKKRRKAKLSNKKMGVNSKIIKLTIKLYTYLLKISLFCFHWYVLL